MVELGYCIGNCKNPPKCFFVKDYFMCGHLLSYNLAIKFKHCILCGNNKFRYAMKNIDGEIVMSNTIIKSTYCYCIRV